MTIILHEKTIKKFIWSFFIVEIIYPLEKCEMMSNLLIGGLVVGLVGGLVLGVLGNTLVDDISDEAGVAIDLVGDDLSAAVGKSNTVRAGHGLAVAGHLVAEAVVWRNVLNRPLERIRMSDLYR